MKRRITALPAMIVAMGIFGTGGVLRHFIALPSGTVACARGLLGVLFLLLFMAFARKRVEFSVFRAHWFALSLGGVCLALDWILLFEAYRHTSVATATVCYYIAPVIVILLAPLVLHERLSLRRALCVGTAFGGIVLVSWSAGEAGWRGILLALCAAVFDAMILLTNKRLAGVPLFDRTLSQLAVATAVLLPYALAADHGAWIRVDTVSYLLLLVMGAVHTGAAYLLYLGAVRALPAQTAALCGYLDPLVAILLSVWVLHEPMTARTALGAVLVLGAALVGERGGRIRRPK